MYFGTWHVGDLDKRSMYVQRLHLIAEEFVKHNLDIVAVSALEFTHRNYPIQVGGYTFFLYGTMKIEERRLLVGFALKDKIACRLTEDPFPISEDTVTLRIPMKKIGFLVLVSVYGPTSQEDYRSKTFYNILDRYLSSLPKHDIICLMGNFNTTVGKKEAPYEKVFGDYGHGILDSSTGNSLLKMCDKYSLVVANSMCSEPEENTNSCYCPFERSWLLMDYVIVHRRGARYVKDVKTIPTIDMSWTLHKPVKCIVAFAVNIYIDNPPFSSWTYKKKNKKSKKCAPSTSGSPKKQKVYDMPNQSEGPSQDTNGKGNAGKN